MSVRRSIKNVAKSYAPCERDVREATSNDKSAASPVVVARIINACYDIQSSRLVMNMIWKRMHDSGKNWRHVFKSLMLLESLLKMGPEHIVVEIRQNIFTVETLTGFQYMGKKSGLDKGANVRDQSATVVRLIKDEALLAAERAVGVPAHQRYTETMGDRARAKASKSQKGVKGYLASEQAALSPALAPGGSAAPTDAAAGMSATDRERIASQQARDATLQQQQAAAAAQGVPAGAQTEEEMVRLAMQMSAMEASSIVARQESQELEEQQLAMALSLSIADANGRLAGDSSDESDGEPTPPSTPYGGDFFAPEAGGGGGGPQPDGLPTYDEAFAFAPSRSLSGASEGGIAPGGGLNPPAVVPATPKPADMTIEIADSAAAAAGIAELESYLSTTAGIGETPAKP